MHNSNALPNISDVVSMLADLRTAMKVSKLVIGNIPLITSFDITIGMDNFNTSLEWCCWIYIMCSDLFSKLLDRWIYMSVSQMCIEMGATLCCLIK